MNITVVYGQNHKGNTYKVTKMLLEKLDCNKKEINEFYVNGMGQCVGCLNCIKKKEELCPHREQVEPIIKAMEKADVIIFSSPNYCFGMTGQLKSFCDHMAYRWMVHRPFDMRNKIGIAISTTAGAGASYATKSIKKQFSWWSVGRVYRLDFAVAAESLEKISLRKSNSLKSKITSISKKVNKKSGKSKPSCKIRILFFAMKIMHKKAAWNKFEREYWELNFK